MMFAYPVQGLDILLRRILDRHKPHRRPASFDSTGFFEVPNTLVVRASRLQASGIVFLCHLAFGLLPTLNVTTFWSALAFPDQIGA
jgi:hypothetical protein